DLIVTGNLNGTYFYEMTYEVGSAEFRLGTKSNTISVSNSQVKLALPFGYAGVTKRKLYRTIAGGAVPLFVAEIADDTTSTYTDNTADGSLGAGIIAINNECPKPYFIETSFGK